jgi:hypothetical protein
MQKNADAHLWKPWRVGRDFHNIIDIVE